MYGGLTLTLTERCTNRIGVYLRPRFIAYYEVRLSPLSPLRRTENAATVTGAAAAATVTGAVAAAAAAATIIATTPTVTATASATTGTATTAAATTEPFVGLSHPHHLSATPYDTTATTTTTAMTTINPTATTINPTAATAAAAAAVNATPSHLHPPVSDITAMVVDDGAGAGQELELGQGLGQGPGGVGLEEGLDDVTAITTPAINHNNNHNNNNHNNNNHNNNNNNEENSECVAVGLATKVFMKHKRLPGISLPFPTLTSPITPQSHLHPHPNPTPTTPIANNMSTVLTRTTHHR